MTLLVRTSVASSPREPRPGSEDARTLGIKEARTLVEGAGGLNDQVIKAIKTIFTKRGLRWPKDLDYL